MKKHLALLLALVLVLGLAIPAYAAPAAKIGVVKSYTDKAITLTVDGKVVTYSYDKKTKVLLNDAPAAFADAACKGTKVSFKLSGKKATELNFAEIGEQYQGSVSLEGDNIVITYPRVLTTDTDNEYTASKVAKVTTEDIGKETDTNYTVRDEKTVDLGAVALVPDSLKVTVDGKEIKVLYDPKAEFDKTVEGDEVRITRDEESENEVVLNFEKAVTTDTANLADAMAKALKVTYEKKIIKVTIVETYKFKADKNMVVNVNGKDATLAQAVNNSTYGYYVLSPEGNVIFINSFYQEMACTITAIKGDTLSISAAPQGKAAFKDTLKLSKVLSVNGGALTVKDLKVKDAIKVTTDPYNGYQVTSITK